MIAYLFFFLPEAGTDDVYKMVVDSLKKGSCYIDEVATHSRSNLVMGGGAEPDTP